MKPYRVLVTGSRTWRSPSDRQTLREALDVILAAFPILVVVHGACSRGADSLAQRWVEDRARTGAQVTAEQHPADWDRYRKAAGFRRNADMVALGADVVLAFHRGASKGTAHTIGLARAANIPVRVYREH